MKAPLFMTPETHAHHFASFTTYMILVDLQIQR